MNKNEDVKKALELLKQDGYLARNVSDDEIEVLLDNLNWLDYEQRYKAILKFFDTCCLKGFSYQRYLSTNRGMGNVTYHELILKKLTMRESKKGVHTIKEKEKVRRLSNCSGDKKDE